MSNKLKKQHTFTSDAANNDLQALTEEGSKHWNKNMRPETAAPAQDAGFTMEVRLLTPVACLSPRASPRLCCLLLRRLISALSPLACWV